MKVIDHTSECADKIGDVEIGDFTIKTTPKSFQILSKGLYSDEISAPIRELATNAYDSHIAAGTENIPFEVHLPSVIEPWFSVRDFGVGMTEDEVKRIYSTYFESTKTESNDYVGCLGLGSKTPFCYTDTFSVISYQDGKKLVYTCYLENGYPKRAKLAEEDTDEPNGMHVQFAVDENDCYKFRYKAELIYNRFINRPKILNCPEFVYESVDYAYQGDNWYIRSNESVSNRGSYAIMGNIAYPFSWHNLNTEATTDELQAIQALIACGIEIRFSIGQLEIAANREALHFDKRTVRNVLAVARDVLLDLQVLIQDKFKACSNMWEARCLHYSIFHDEHLFDKSLQTVLKKLSYTYNGEKVRSNFNLDQAFPYDNPSLELYTYSYPKRRRSGMKKARRTYERVVKCHDNIKFAVNDAKIGGVSRIRYYVEQIENQEVFLIDSHSPINQKILAELGYPHENIIKTSDLQKPPRVSNGGGSAQRKNIKEWRRTTSVYEYSNWNDTVIDDITDGEFFYVRINKSTVFDGNRECRSHYLSSIRQHLIKYDLIDTDTIIYGVPYHQSRKIEKMSNWLNVFEYARNELRAEFTSMIPELTQARSNLMYARSNCDRFNDVITICDLLKDVSEFKNILNDINEFKSSYLDNTDDIAEFEYIASFLSEDIDTVQSPIDINEIYDTIMESYPMLKYIVLSAVDANELKQYVSLMKKMVD